LLGENANEQAHPLLAPLFFIVKARRIFKIQQQENFIYLYVQSALRRMRARSGVDGDDALVCR
jgi:hypothetical protein